jgi:hypothetical protein
LSSDYKARLHIYTESVSDLSFLRRLKIAIKIRLLKTYPGHSGVTKSLVHGLKRAKIPYSLNCPYKEIAPKDFIVCLSGISSLKSLITWKSEGGSSNPLFVGPNTMVRSNEFDCILANPLIDQVIVPSKWIEKAYIEDLPLLEKKISIWAAGVDVDYWKPTHKRREKILLYLKNDIIDVPEEYLKTLPSDVIKIRYGSYSHEELKAALDQSFCCIYLSKCESQGLALAQMWSMGCKTYVYKPPALVIGEKTYNEFSTAPYLVEQVGEEWTGLLELKSKIESMVREPAQTRSYVTTHFSNEVSARKLFGLFTGF